MNDIFKNFPLDKTLVAEERKGRSCVFCAFCNTCIKKVIPCHADQRKDKKEVIFIWEEK